MATHTRHFVLTIFIACIVSVSTAAPSYAARVFWGNQERLHVIADTKILNSGILLKLCYKATTRFALAGIYTFDDYVLCESETSTKYWPMPNADQLASLQEKGLIPDPLPKYERPIFDYVIGYSLWILIGVVALLWLLGVSRSKADGEKAIKMLKTASRRVMAWMAIGRQGSTEMGAVTAQQIYKSMFGEPLPDSDIAADLQWVRDEPAAFDNYLGAVGRKLNRNGKFILLKSGAHVVLAGGTLDAQGEAAIHHIAKQLGLFHEEAENLIENLRDLQKPKPPPVPEAG